MTLLDHFVANAGLSIEEGGNGFVRLPVSYFVSALAYAKRGAFGNAAAARTAIINRFNLQADDLAELDIILNDLNSIRDNDRSGIALFLLETERALAGLEGNVADKTQGLVHIRKRPDVVPAPVER
jgi:hypothetical protein